MADVERRTRLLSIQIGFIVIGPTAIIVGLIIDRSSIVAAGGAFTGIGVAVVTFRDLLRDGSKR